jgi:hypothetical protein
MKTASSRRAPPLTLGVPKEGVIYLPIVRVLIKLESADMTMNGHTRMHTFIHVTAAATADRVTASHSAGMSSVAG